MSVKGGDAMAKMKIGAQDQQGNRRNRRDESNGRFSTAGVVPSFLEKDILEATARIRSIPDKANPDAVVKVQAIFDRLFSCNRDRDFNSLAKRCANRTNRKRNCVLWQRREIVETMGNSLVEIVACGGRKIDVRFKYVFRRESDRKRQGRSLVSCWRNTPVSEQGSLDKLLRVRVIPRCQLQVRPPARIDDGVGQHDAKTLK